jgi:hypothetical protein
MNVILVGGTQDGLRIVLPEGQMRHEVVVYESMRVNANLSTISDIPVIYTKQCYNLFQLHPVTRVVIFAHEALTPTQIMERLLDGYAPKK